MRMSIRVHFRMPLPLPEQTVFSPKTALHDLLHMGQYEDNVDISAKSPCGFLCTSPHGACAATENIV